MTPEEKKEAKRIYDIQYRKNNQEKIIAHKEKEKLRIELMSEDERKEN